MAVANFSTRNDTWRKLMGNGLSYHVPRFQRDYSWGEEEWSDLWHDMLDTIRPEGESAHYMGYLVLQSTDDKRFDIIDGQQRLTTLCLLVLAGLRQLQKQMDEGKDIENTRRRMEGLRQTYIGYLDPVTLVPTSKLTLNRNNDPYFQTYLVPLANNLPRRGFKASEHRLRKAFEWFERHVRDYVQHENDAGKAVAHLIDAMSDKLFFTVITVTDQLNAYKVFETLNARGVRLSSTDLLKNYLFSLLDRAGRHERELESLDNRWEQIIGRLGAESFPDFLRAHWISRRTFVRKSDLFKTIRSRITNQQDVFTLLAEMEEDMDAYLALTQPDASQWPKQQREYVRNLRMFSVRQPLPLLLAAQRTLDQQAFTQLLRAIVIISFRYNVIGNYQTGDQERAYHTEAIRIAEYKHKTLRQILDGLHKVYPNDDQFRSSFAEKYITVKQARNRRIVRYILCEIECQISGVAPDFESSNITLEHICPANPNDGWEKFTDEDIDKASSRLGNMLLLEESMNRNLGNATYDVKRKAYKSSAYQMVQNVAKNYREWTPERIDARQLDMAKMATSIWRIAQLH